MAEVKTLPVVATQVKGIDDEAPDRAPGAFEFYVNSAKEIAGMIYMCPCGCGKTGALSFKPANSPSWSWDGNREQPTLTPSVHDVGHWHGFLTKGVWLSC